MLSGFPPSPSPREYGRNTARHQAPGSQAHGAIMEPMPGRLRQSKASPPPSVAGRMPITYCSGFFLPPRSPRRWRLAELAELAEPAEPWLGKPGLPRSLLPSHLTTMGADVVIPSVHTRPAREDVSSKPPASWHQRHQRHQQHQRPALGSAIRECHQ